MSDRRELREMTAAVSLGVLAQEMVLVAGRLRRGESLEERDRETLSVARDLLKRLGTDATSVFSPGRPRRMGDEAALIDVFRAVRTRAPEEPVRAFLERLADALDRALRGESLSADDQHLLVEVQALFSEIGELTLTRTNELFDRRRKEQLGWTTNVRSSAS